MLHQIDIDDLKPGMFVNSVIEQTGQLKVKTKGVVKSSASIESLKLKGVVTLEIDLSKGSSAADSDAQQRLQPSQTNGQQTGKNNQQQLAASCQLYDDALLIQRRFFERIQADDQPSLTPIRQMSSRLIDAVIDMPSGMSCLTLLNRSGNYLLEHALNCSILLTMFAHHRGLERSEIEELSLAGMLMDVGMANMPNEMLESPKKLSASEKQVVITHVDIGLDLVERCGDISDTVRDVIFNHHERVDGSGYPDAQRDADVSVAARMAAIVDSYDAMTSLRPYKKSVTPAVALHRLLKSPQYDQTLVAEFIHCVGIHPVGSLVKLSNDRLAIVIRGNKTAPLQPVVASFYHINTANYSEVKPIDLRHSELQIQSSVRPEEFGLNLTKFFREIFIHTV